VAAGARGVGQPDRRPRGEAVTTRDSPRLASRVMAKLDARDRAQVVVAAYESGLVKPGHRDALLGATLGIHVGDD
jgi:hypothetical protein